MAQSGTVRAAALGSESLTGPVIGAAMVEAVGAGAHPQVTIGAGEQGGDMVAADRIGLMREVTVVGEAPAGPIVPVQAAALRADPKAIVPRRQQRPGDVLAESFGIARAVGDLSGLPPGLREAHEPSVGGRPELTVLAAGQVQDHRIPQVIRQVHLSVNRAVGYPCAVETAALRAQPGPARFRGRQHGGDIAVAQCRAAQAAQQPEVGRMAGGAVQSAAPRADEHHVLREGQAHLRLVPQMGDRAVRLCALHLPFEGCRVQQQHTVSQRAEPQPIVTVRRHGHDHGQVFAGPGQGLAPGTFYSHCAAQEKICQSSDPR